MDLAKLKPNPSAEVELSNAPGFFVTLASKDSPEVKAEIQRLAEKRMSSVLRTGKVKPPTLDQIREETVGVLRAAIIGIRDTTENPLEFTPENVDEILAIDWIREELDRALQNQSLFFGN